MATDQIQLLCTFSRDQVERALASAGGADPRARTEPLHLGPGDRVRITFEGTVVAGPTYPAGVLRLDSGAFCAVPDGATFERIPQWLRSSQSPIPSWTPTGSAR